MDHERAIRFLQGLGYRVLFRQDGWVECLASREAERWTGRGTTEADALDDVMGRMFPSRASRQLLQCEFDRQANQATAPIGSDPDVAATQMPGRAQKSGEESPVGSTDASTEAVVKPARRPPERRLVRTPARPAKAGGSGSGARRDSTDEKGRPAAPVPRGLPENGARQEALEELSALHAKIEAARPELALAAPRVQRIQITAWISRARSVQDSLPGDYDVERAAGRVAGLLGRICKLWWPGSVAAMQLRAIPPDAGDQMGLHEGGRLHTWRDAADAADRLLQREVERTEDSGWADSDRLDPAPVDPGDLLAEVAADVQEVLGSLEEAPAGAALRPLCSSDQSDGQTVECLVQWAMKLRWLRGHAADPETWARLMGRLRWVNDRTPGVQANLGPILDPAFRPPLPWSAMLGRDPLAGSMRRIRKELVRSLPGPTSDGEAVASWLSRAFEIEQELPLQRIARLVRPVRELVLGLREDSFPEGAPDAESKLDRLKTLLSEQEQEEASRPLSTGGESQAPDGPDAVEAGKLEDDGS